MHGLAAQSPCRLAVLPVMAHLVVDHMQDEHRGHPWTIQPGMQADDGLGTSQVRPETDRADGSVALARPGDAGLIQVGKPRSMHLGQDGVQIMQVSAQGGFQLGSGIHRAEMVEAIL